MDLEPFVPIEELAKHFTVSVATIRAWQRQGWIPRDTYIKVGLTYRFRLSKVVEALTASSTPEPPPEPLETSTELDAPVQLELAFDPDQDA